MQTVRGEPAINISGIIIVDKPAGWTSHDVVAKLRGALKTKRIGHGGTLDPIATGVLPLFIGHATRAAEFCENAEKEYIAGIRIGLTTDTQDITGATIEEKAPNVTLDELKAAIMRFRGAQKQIPPMYSAIKQNGKKLYELARRGVTVPREARDVRIHEIELLGGSGADYLLKVVCSKGTYIRTLCHDIGISLGCGAAMSSLRRTRACSYTIEAAHTLESVLQSASSTGDLGGIILPTDSIFAGYKAIALNGMDTRKCINGAELRIMGHADGMYRLYGPDDGFLALGEIVKGETRIIKRFFEVTQQ